MQGIRATAYFSKPIGTPSRLVVGATAVELVGLCRKPLLSILGGCECHLFIILFYLLHLNQMQEVAKRHSISEYPWEEMKLNNKLGEGIASECDHLIHLFTGASGVIYDASWTRDSSTTQVMILIPYFTSNSIQVAVKVFKGERESGRGDDAIRNHDIRWITPQ